MPPQWREGFRVNLFKKAHVSKSAVMVFARDSVDGTWKWGGGSIFSLECQVHMLGR